MEHQHSSQDHSYHSMNPSMNHAGHDHHKMMLADFKNQFYVVHRKK